MSSRSRWCLYDCEKFLVVGYRLEESSPKRAVRREDLDESSPTGANRREHSRHSLDHDRNRAFRSLFSEFLVADGELVSSL